MRLFRPAVWATVGFFAVLGVGGSGNDAQAADCSQVVKTVWLESYSVQAETQGDCGQADISLVIRNSNGDIAFEATYGPEDLFGFYGLQSHEDMRLALTDWIVTYADQSGSSKLPVWPQGAEGPDAGEFPFYAEGGVTREIYEGARGENRQMVCFIQGSESQLCLLKHPVTGDLEAIGVQTFPG